MTANAARTDLKQIKSGRREAVLLIFVAEQRQTVWSGAVLALLVSPLM